jgi:hypothetical protein
LIANVLAVAAAAAKKVRRSITLSSRSPGIGFLSCRSLALQQRISSCARTS